MRRFNIGNRHGEDSQGVRYPLIGKIVLAVFIYIFTFPAIEPDLAPGLDASYVWGLNWLFANDYSMLSQLIYPIGPLALLKLPAIEGFNFIWFLIVYSILKFWFIADSFRLAEYHSRNFYAAGALIAVASYFAGFDLMVVFLSIMLCFKYVRTGRFSPFILATILAFVGLFVKTSIGVSALSVLFVAWLMDFYKNRSFKRILAGASVVLAVAILVGMAVLHDFSRLIDYFWGEMHLVTGYGGALSLHPDNNWIVLGVFLFVMIAFLLFTKDRDPKILFFLSLIPLFASWKHAFVREDITHYQAIITFVVVLWCIILMSRTMRRGIAVVCALLSVMMLYSNMKEIPDYKGRKIEYCGINNFTDVTFGYRDFKERMNRLTDDALVCDKLPDEVVSMIRNSTIDFYPWEHIYAKVNKLNWHPRKTVELGASTSKWLSDVAAENFSSENAVDYVLWHFGKDGYTIDGRYPLNDEPNVVFNILQNYEPKYYGENYVLFGRNESPRTIRVIGGEKSIAKLNEWISVPDCGNNIQRVKVETGVTFAGFMKKTFFKDEMYFVDYMTDDGEMYSYRYVPSTAVDGLWVNPLVTRFVDGELAGRVSKIRFRVSNNSCVKDEISLQFETFDISLGECVQTHRDVVTMLYVDDFESTSSNVTDVYAYDGRYSNMIDPQGFSSTYEIQMDSLWNMVADSCDLYIKASCRFLNTNASQMVVSIDGNENSFYDYCVFGKNGLSYWWRSDMKCRISREDYPTGLLKVYVWNNGSDPTYIDDMKVAVANCCDSINNR